MLCQSLSCGISEASVEFTDRYGLTEGQRRGYVLPSRNLLLLWSHSYTKRGRLLYIKMVNHIEAPGQNGIYMGCFEEEKDSREQKHK